MTFNLELSAKQLTDDEITAVEVVHKYLNAFLMRPGMYVEEQDVASITEGIEFTLQLLLKFPLNRNYHSYRHRVEGCLCGSLNNLDQWGTPRRVVTQSCPFHGNKDTTAGLTSPAVKSG